MTSLTQQYTLSLIAYAEERGWKVDLFESREPTLFRSRPRFQLVLTRRTGDGFAYEIFSFQAFIGSGRMSGVMRRTGYGKDYKSRFSNWSHARIVLDSYGARKAKTG